MRCPPPRSARHCAGPDRLTPHGEQQKRNPGPNVSVTERRADGRHECPRGAVSGRPEKGGSEAPGRVCSGGRAFQVRLERKAPGKGSERGQSRPAGGATPVPQVGSGDPTGV